MFGEKSGVNYPLSERCSRNGSSSMRAEQDKVRKIQAFSWRASKMLYFRWPPLLLPHIRQDADDLCSQSQKGIGCLGSYGNFSADGEHGDVWGVQFG
jgi:hypothetical protein